MLKSLFYNSINPGNEIIKNYMNFYEHTIIARQDLSQNDLKAVEEKYGL